MSNNQIKKKNLLIICRGAGDLATGIIHRLHRAGHRVIALETDYPAAIRRQVSFCEAVYDGSATVEGLTARLLPALNDAETISGINDTPQAHIASQKWKSSAIEAVLEAGEVPLLIDPTGESIALFRPDVVVDAIIAKKNLGTTINMSPLVITGSRPSMSSFCNNASMEASGLGVILSIIVHGKETLFSSST